ncbi:hypothetical protein IEQ34_016046 [Dendrobium chrysotoxum]|uniref:Uncharacterized protein n=1 Tax=Dendrobium chrysotoxum TaxID=161865 RepID=A0AAV7GD94_DENCH|nr:hypothetical protein IEQ34_016046 [Dendrobium chrysotoxum]
MVHRTLYTLARTVGAKESLCPCANWLAANKTLYLKESARSETTKVLSQSAKKPVKSRSSSIPAKPGENAKTFFFGQLLFLKSLKLVWTQEIKWLKIKFNGNDKYHAFPLLEELDITKLKALKDWFEAGVVAEDGGLFPCLIELVLRDCLILKELPSLPHKLKTLEIYKIGWTTLNFSSNSDYIPLEII